MTLNRLHIAVGLVLQEHHEVDLIRAGAVIELHADVGLRLAVGLHVAIGL